MASLADPLPPGADLYGVFGTERKAKNALKRLATAHRICHSLLGLEPARSAPAHACRECAPTAYGASLACAVERPHHLLRLLTGIAPAKIQAWPYRGPIAIREGRRVHVFDRWEHLGTVRAGADIPALLQQRRGRFDPEVYAVLKRALPKLAAKAVRNIPVPEAADAGANAGDLIYERS